MSELVEHSGCPPFESISAYVDGEAEKKVVQHVGACESCLRVASSLRSLDAAITRSCQPREGLADRIVAACADKPIPQAIPFWGHSLLRYAAALAITGVLALAVRQAVQTSPLSQQPDAPYLAAVEPGTLDHADAGGGNLPMSASQIRSVGTQQDGGVPMTATVAKRPVAEEVAHVWGAKDLDTVKTNIETQLPQDIVWGFSNDGNGVQIQARLTDEQLQNLVDAIHQQGYDLFSSQLPQPNQRDRVNFSGSRNVLYQARFVTIGKQ